MDKSCALTYKIVDSPLGKMELSGCERGLHGIRLLGRKRLGTGPTTAPEAPEPPDGPAEAPEPLEQCAAWLQAYFQEPTAVADLPLPALHHPVFRQESFSRQVLRTLLAAVKVGETVSYRQLAALAGHPKAARAVGGAMRRNPVPILVPCHRVTCSSGAVGHYSGGLGVKEWLLAHEGSLAGTPAQARGAPRGSRPAKPN
ncbi:methylated-DNA--protein-cysteine methyltransferase [Talpa occidentalis]|uniref:methylated-DNA--protein-cysteine methyltransferase n=1 Tax=Talpa occidentalis TaxID=50954 RepID=UPI00188E4848|nr:methylated-DNA--protein-cysteine methyltransferase [Talpa occidentalis]